ncbi:hypothetical protein L211DRAFT_841629 [Terfezia boudieri ATCC MYA-4762]|uniref:Uncharacterized protein n=1 Tax=Terfezia boudieri ATCC MYA-4762 TaxID=1051890 RepID=A0A3N4LIS1_9PEZI|nr:hypothetical protein L211DRAFT_841629 [Terfezia boudieri ATCC MYA-4762]
MSIANVSVSSIRTQNVLRVLLAILLLLILLYSGWRGNTLKDDMHLNRTKWPMNGGNIQIIPGWNAGQPTAFFYVNMGYGNNPANHSNPMAGLKPGDNVTIQVIQVALHGCADVTLVETAAEADSMVDRCENSTTIGFNQVYSIRSKRLALVVAVVWGVWLVEGML